MKEKLLSLGLRLGLAALPVGEPTTEKSRSSEAMGARETLGTIKTLGAGFVEAAAVEADKEEVFLMLGEERECFLLCSAKLVMIMIDGKFEKC